MTPRSRDPAERRAAGATDLARAGAHDARVVIVVYDPIWPERFRVEADRLAVLLPDLAPHHVGSTAVPGLAAKPIIDSMARVDDIDAPLAALTRPGGYVYPESYNAALGGRRWLCRPSPAFREYHLHLVADRAELSRHLRFRDALRASPALAAEYAAIKRDLARRMPDDREGYTGAKSAFISRVAAGA